MDTMTNPYSEELGRLKLNFSRLKPGYERNPESLKWYERDQKRYDTLVKNEVNWQMNKMKMDILSKKHQAETEKLGLQSQQMNLPGAHALGAVAGGDISAGTFTGAEGTQQVPIYGTSHLMEKDKTPFLLRDEYGQGSLEGLEAQRADISGLQLQPQAQKQQAKYLQELAGLIEKQTPKVLSPSEVDYNKARTRAGESRAGMYEAAQGLKQRQGRRQPMSSIKKEQLRADIEQKKAQTEALGVKKLPKWITHRTEKQRFTVGNKEVLKDVEILLPKNEMEANLQLYHLLHGNKPSAAPQGFNPLQMMPDLISGLGNMFKSSQSAGPAPSSPGGTQGYLPGQDMSGTVAPTKKPAQGKQKKITFSPVDIPNLEREIKGKITTDVLKNIKKKIIDKLGEDYYNKLFRHVKEQEGGRLNVRR